MEEDLSQIEVINSNDNLLVLASAGCGKTSTIVRKVNKIIKYISPCDILIISFTNETVNDLKKKIAQDIDTYTFHKLALKILKDNNYTYRLTNDSLLKYIINEFFVSLISNNEKKFILNHFKFLNYSNFLVSKSYTNLKYNIFRYISFIKSYNKNFNNMKFNSFLTIIYKIYLIYENEKKSQSIIDLDDVIVIATNISKKSTFKYKYIFVDEFQDTSDIRFNLIYTLFKNSNSVINFFGDDFQSIYSFNGCNVSIMLNIKKYIPNIKTMTINVNYRSDNFLIQCANKFISKNLSQLTKSVHSNISIDKSINILYYLNFNFSFNKLISYLEKLSSDILIIGRYNIDLIKLNTNHKKLTIHRSKGLEADYVILINNKCGINGFPSKLKYNELLNDFLKNFEPIKYAEERRLFYVAITRAKKKVYLLTPFFSPSPFIKELEKILK